jgi:heme exporter protein B
MTAGFGAQVAAVARRDLRRERRRGDVVWVVVPFGAVALLLLPLAVGTDAALLHRIGPGMFWLTVMLFGVLVAVGRGGAETPAQRDAASLTGLDPAAGFVGRAVSVTVLLLVFELVVGVVALILYDIEFVGVAWMVLAVLLVAAGLGLLSALAASLVQATGAGSVLVPLLVAPLSIPLLLGATQSYEGLQRGDGIVQWMLLMAAVVLAAAIVGVITARPLQET